MKELFIIKVGGNVIDDPEKLSIFLKKFGAINTLKILIHGGGKLATELSAKLGIEAKMVDGKRITDRDTLKVVTMVYAGLINKSVVSQLNKLGTKALGICGADLNLIPAKKREVTSIDYGFVGDVLIDKIPAEQWENLLDKNICPVVAPITSDSTGQLLNTNADTIASSIAQALSKIYKVTLVYCFEKDGVLKDPNDDTSVIPTMLPKAYEDLKSVGIISKGMIPKLDNSWEAIRKGVLKVIIGNALQVDKLISLSSGTQLCLN
jgi:acetylglutamate kinase